MRKTQSLIIYQPYSGMPVETIKNSSVIKFMLSMMYGSTEAKHLMTDPESTKLTYQNAKTFHQNAIKFVDFMNAKYYNHNGDYLLNVTKLPFTYTNNPYRNGKWIRQSLIRLTTTAQHKQAYFRGVKGLTRLQLRRVFRILAKLESINMYQSPRFFF